jgi:hypothetical protein
MSDKQTGVYEPADRNGFVVIHAGARYAMDRPAAKNADGSISMDQLRSDEIVVAPGLIYRRVRT